MTEGSIFCRVWSNSLKNFKAIKNGDIFVHHNSGFLFSCVNADVADWIVKRTKNDIEILSLANRDQSAVGTKIITKSLKGHRFDVITDEYKFPEGSEDKDLNF